MRHILLTAGLLATLAACAADIAPYTAPATVPKTGIGFRGDGTGIFPDSRPPTTWDEATGKNILWKAPLPNWGYSSPVPVGNRVFFMSEPAWRSVWPELCCFDADTGALVWKTAVDPCDALPDMTPEKRKEITDGVAWVHELLRVAYRVTGDMARKGGAAPDSPEVKAANEELGKYGMAIKEVRLSYGQLRTLSYSGETAARLRTVGGLLRRHGITAETTWQRFGRARVGACFPTPVSDGQAIYVTTLHGTVACYDMEGNLKWSRWAKFTGHHGLMSSPRLYGDLLLTGWFDTGAFDPRVVAYDKATGEERWQATLRPATPEGHKWGSRPGSSLVVMSVGDTDVLLCSTGHVLRLPDGKVFDAKIGPCLATWGIDDEHDAIFSYGHSDRAEPRFGIELTMVDGDLKTTPRWVINPNKLGQGPSPVYVDGKLFVSGYALDPATGYLPGRTTEADRNAPQTGPRTNHLLLVANGHIYGLSEVQKRLAKDAQPTPADVQGICEVYTLDGKRVAANVLTAAPREGEKADQWNWQGWGGYSFSYCNAMNIGGDRLYICSDDYLYCIGEKKE